MPAPIDWTAAGGLPAVQTLTIALGPREAARRLNLSDAHAAALRQLCARGHWLSPDARPVSPQAVTSDHQPVTIEPPDAVAVLAAVRVERATTMPGCHQPVTTAPDALAEANADYSRRSRTAALRATARGLEHLAEQPPDLILADAANGKALVGMAAQAGDWQAAAGAGVSVNILVQ